ncbi:hypothetical protein [Streptomyces sp. NPDC047061]|uniref:hypothetical protein n=1 Tax=Streptomyces sp. NPDC047061 TaxID=3154605 RepID=UPI0033DCB78E
MQIELEESYGGKVAVAEYRAMVLREFDGVPETLKNLGDEKAAKSLSGALASLKYLDDVRRSGRSCDDAFKDLAYLQMNENERNIQEVVFEHLGAAREIFRELEQEEGVEWFQQGEELLRMATNVINPLCEMEAEIIDRSLSDAPDEQGNGRTKRRGLKPPSERFKGFIDDYLDVGMKLSIALKNNAMGSRLLRKIRANPVDYGVSKQDVERLDAHTAKITKSMNLVPRNTEDVATKLKEWVLSSESNSFSAFSGLPRNSAVTAYRRAIADPGKFGLTEDELKERQAMVRNGPIPSKPSASEFLPPPFGDPGSASAPATVKPRGSENQQRRGTKK